MPARLVLYDHSEIYRRKVDWLRSQQSAIALMTLQMTRVATAGFGGKESTAELEDFMPIKAILPPDDPRLLMANYLGKETQLIFDRVTRSKNANPYLIKAFNKNEILVEAMEMLRKSTDHYE